MSFEKSLSDFLFSALVAADIAREEVNSCQEDNSQPQAEQLSASKGLSTGQVTAAEQHFQQLSRLLRHEFPIPPAGSCNQLLGLLLLPRSSGPEGVRCILLSILYPILKCYQLLLRELRQQADRQLAARRLREIGRMLGRNEPLLSLLQDVSLHRGLLILLEQEGGLTEAGRMLDTVHLYAESVRRSLQLGEVGEKAHQLTSMRVRSKL